MAAAEHQVRRASAARSGLFGCQGPAGEADRTGSMRNRNRLDRRQAVRSRRDDADRSGHVDRLYTFVEDGAEAGVRLGAAPWAGCRPLD
jgi:hypothetical protein